MGSSQPGRANIRFQRRSARVEHGELRLVLDVHEHAAAAVCAREFRLAVEHDRRDDLVAARIDHGRAVSAAVEREDAFARGIEQDRVGILAGGNAREHRVAAQIEHLDDVRLAAADVAAPQFGCERDAVHARRVGDFGDRFAGRRIDDLHAVGPRQIEPVGLRVDAGIVPAARAAEGEPGRDARVALCRCIRAAKKSDGGVAKSACIHVIEPVWRNPLDSSNTGSQGIKNAAFR